VRSTFYIVEIDRVKYSKAAKIIKEILKAEGLELLNKKTQEYIDFGLSAVGLPRDEFVLTPRGDDAIIFFKDARLVHEFSKAVHEYTQQENANVEPEFRCWFRIGCGYDKDVLLKDEKLGSDPASYGRAIATRLRSAAIPGGMLIDLETYGALPLELQAEYGEEEEVIGKDHDEPFRCRRWTIISSVEDKLIAESEEIKKKKLEGELATCTKALESHPENLELWKNKINLLGELGQIEDVEIAVASASSIAPNQHVLLVLEGDLLWTADSHEKAILSYVKALATGLGRKDYAVWLKLARSYFIMKKYEEAVEPYQKALELYREPIDAHQQSPKFWFDSSEAYLICHEYGMTLEKLNRFHESINLYSTSLCLHPNYRIANYNRKQMYKKIYSGNR
jgi:tetratricopeptide (TPR) repeat protein